MFKRVKVGERLKKEQNKKKIWIPWRFKKNPPPPPKKKKK